ncbi:MAG: hypothetical protein LBS52_03150, partial [Dysgonamonadaceae bacterium]|nr:hypothetical protein [Dysgonamonadaceae bacterium]
MKNRFWGKWFAFGKKRTEIEYCDNDLGQMKGDADSLSVNIIVVTLILAFVLLVTYLATGIGWIGIVAGILCLLGMFIFPIFLP